MHHWALFMVMVQDEVSFVRHADQARARIRRNTCMSIAHEIMVILLVVNPILIAEVRLEIIPQFLFVDSIMFFHSAGGGCITVRRRWLRTLCCQITIYWQCVSICVRPVRIGNCFILHTSILWIDNTEHWAWLSSSLTLPCWIDNHIRDGRGIFHHILEMQSIMDLVLDFDRFVKTEIVMALFQSIKVDVLVVHWEGFLLAFRLQRRLRLLHTVLFFLSRLALLL